MDVTVLAAHLELIYIISVWTEDVVRKIPGAMRDRDILGEREREREREIRAVSAT